MAERARYDVVVVGAGLAGSEVAYASAGAGLTTLLVTTSLDTVYNLAVPTPLAPPAGTLMEALLPHGGEPAVFELHRAAKAALEALPTLHLLQSNVEALEVEGGAAVGVRTWEGVPQRGIVLALCVGAFLGARLSLGSTEERAGRLGEMSYDELHDDLVAHGFVLLPAEVVVPAAPARPGYRVAFRCFAAEEGDRTGALPRLAGLYVAGRCLDPDATPERRAADGRALGLHLVDLLTEGPD